MRAYPQADGRGIIARKWSAYKEGGPLVLLCERIQKKMIQFGWPCRYEVEKTNRVFPLLARWFHLDGCETPQFWEALQNAVEIVSSACRFPAVLCAGVLSVDDGFSVDVKTGRIVRGFIRYEMQPDGKAKKIISETPF